MIAPMVAKLVKDPFDREDWLFERRKIPGSKGALSSAALKPRHRHAP